MTGLCADADDLTQEALARALERCDEATSGDPTGWLLRLTTRLCIDHLRRKRVERRVTELVDPLHGPEWLVPQSPVRAPDFEAILREDTRFAVVTALQFLSPRQRAVLILHDVCACSLDEIAETLSTNPGAAKAALQRARVALHDQRIRGDTDVPVDQAMVEQLAAAVEAGSIDAIRSLLADDVWGIVDGGGVIRAATKPTFGARAVSRQWANAKRRLGDEPVTATILTLNGEPALVLRLASVPEGVLAVVHVESRQGRISALRVSRDPRKAARLGALPAY
jgi:RNA polymerase sigma-70 factor (ECF subfamily)